MAGALVLRASEGLITMATADDVRRLALALPETDEHPSYGGRPSFRVRGKGFARLLDDGESCGIWLESIEEVADRARER